MYQRYSETIAAHLIWLLNMPEAKGRPATQVRAAKAEIKRRMKELASALRFLSEEGASAPDKTVQVGRIVAP
jgi:hypothetical protein